MPVQSASVHAELGVVTASALPQQLIGALEHRSSAADHSSPSSRPFTGGHAAHAFALPVRLPFIVPMPKTQCVVPNARVLRTTERSRNSLQLMPPRSFPYMMTLACQATLATKAL